MRRRFRSRRASLILRITIRFYKQGKAVSILFSTVVVLGDSSRKLSLAGSGMKQKLVMFVDFSGVKKMV